jgi:hypothetical protein
MAGQQQQQHDRSQMNANWWAPERQRSPTPPDGVDVPSFVPRVSQAPMNLARDDSRDGMTLDTASNSKATTDSVWSFESMRDIHEFIREVNGRRYNAKNTTYFLPAGELPNVPACLSSLHAPSPLPGCIGPPLHT